MATKPEPERRLRISLIVPVQDEEATIRALLTSVVEQEVLPDELILVDAGSTDRTHELAAQVGLPPSLVRWVRAERVFPGVARNRGAAEARYEWLAFTDAGISLERHWLKNLVRAVEHGAAEVAFGSYDPVCDSFLRQSAAVAYVPARAEGGVRGPSVVSLLLRKTLFDRIGGFPPYRAAEDLGFLERLRALKPNIAFAPDAIARWYTAPTLGRTYERFALYSFHNLVAGRGWQWHAGVLRLYAALAGGVAACLAAGLGAFTLALFPLFYAARAGKAAWHKQASLPFSPVRLSHLAGAAILLVAVDAATLAGTLRWLGKGRPRLP